MRLMAIYNIIVLLSTYLVIYLLTGYLPRWWEGDAAIAAAVPPRPQDGTVSVIVLFTIVSSCVTDCNL